MNPSIFDKTNSPSILLSNNLDKLSSILQNYGSQSFVNKIVMGTADSSDVKTFDQYKMISKIRHDTIHWLICNHRDLPFGEKPVGSFNWNDKVKAHRYYHLIKNQTPDILNLDGYIVNIAELTISRVKTADLNKLSKYRMLVDVLTSCGYEVNLEVILINSTYAVPDYGFLSSEHRFSDELIDTIYDVIRNVELVYHRLYETQLGREFYLKEHDVTRELADFKITNEDIINQFRNSECKPFNNEDDLIKILQEEYPDTISEDDDKMIDHLVDKALHIDSKLSKNQKADEVVKEIRNFHMTHQNKMYPDDVRSFMPLPYFEQLQIDSAERTTIDDESLFIMLKAKMEYSGNQTLIEFSKMPSIISKVKLSKQTKFLIAMEGPNRKHYVKAGSQPHIDQQNKRKSTWFPISDNSHIDEVSWWLSQIDLDPDCKTPMDLDGPGIRYMKICQSIFRELNINALRKDRSRSHILKPTGVKGLFILIYRGAKLRTGENLSIIWFKLILMKEHFVNVKYGNSWIFKRMNADGDLLHSNWLSTDANRLDHYIRLHDKIMSAYACYCSMSGRKMLDEMMISRSNCLGMIMMIYLEDKRSTSKMLQDVRYLVMSSLSMFNYYRDIISKFTEPIRTPLQSYLLDLILKFPLNPNLKQAVLSSNFGKLNVDSSTGEAFDKLTGADIQLPRILTKGPLINFKQMLCEMYFTMLFNKNQDDPTHSSFQILTKILEGEKSLDEVKVKTNLYNGYDKSDIEDLDYLIDNPHKNQYSRSMIMIASKLQASSIFNRSSGSLAHTLAATHKSLNKSLDEFATFKSSSTFENPILNMKVYRTDKTKEENIEMDVKKHITGNPRMQNRRRRCLEGVQELIEKGYLRSYDLVNDEIMNPLHYQIFKKNQIGGVREILILDIEKRILINIMESMSRVICHEDDREMLTHGDKKITLMRDLLRQLKRGSGKKAVMHYNMDKTRWAPSFMPMQFMYMFLPFKNKYPSMFRFIISSLLTHTNKRFILPEKLIRAWMADINNDYKHWMDPNLQKLKEKFLDSKELSYINESNMGQGILHYTSSYYHLCFISLRDEVYKRLCKKVNVSPGEWRDLVSSDDSYTAHALPLDDKKRVHLRIVLFLRAQEVCERIMNIWTSTSKSSLSLLIYEFNSLFGSNLTMFPTTFKFALAATHPVNTDSFFRMVKESYISCRQIVENGGSLELYEYASSLNKRFCESIYHTTSGPNDLKQFGLRLERVPYQLGVYPLDDPALMIIFGPEIQNYKILFNQENDPTYLNAKEKQLFNIMHTMVDINEPELYAAMNNVDDVFVGVNRIEAHMGPIKRLELIKRQIPMSKEEIMSHVIADPLMLFREPNNKIELQIKVFMKLFQKGAPEALRTTAASIYYGRVAATVSANAFSIPFDERQEYTTYSNCIAKLLEMKCNPVDMKYMYPHFDEFKSLHRLSTAIYEYTKRDPMETQNIRNLQLTKLQQRISNPIMSLLNHYWVDPDTEVRTSFERDWLNLKDSVPIIKDTLIETLDQFKGDPEKRTKSLLLVLLRLMGYSSKPMKAIIYGPSSRSFDNSYLILKQQNLYHDSTTDESRGLYMSQNIVKRTDKLAFAFNCFALSTKYGYHNGIRQINKPWSPMTLIDDEDIYSFLLDNTLGISSYKKMIIMLMATGKLEDIRSWSRKTKNIFHKWIKRGHRRNDGLYVGDYMLKLQLADHILLVSYNQMLDKLTLTINDTSNMFYLYELIHEAIQHSNLTSQEFISKVDRGVFILSTNKLIFGLKDSGIKMLIDPNLSDIQYQITSIKNENGFLSVHDDYGQIFKTVEGLFHSSYIPDEKEFHIDININSVSLKALIPYRPFDVHFSVEHLSIHDCLKLIKNNKSIDVLDDLIVPKPSVSIVTNQRLDINYPTRDLEVEFSSALTEPELQEDDVKFNVEPPFDYIDMLIQTDDLENIISGDYDILQSNIHDTWLDPDIDLDILKTMTRQKIAYQPKMILEKVLNVKYQIITRMVTNINMLNRGTIEAITHHMQNRYITYSLIYCYDRQFTNLDTPSPYGCEMSINPEFAKIYGFNRSHVNLDI